LPQPPLPGLNAVRNRPFRKVVLRKIILSSAPLFAVLLSSTAHADSPRVEKPTPREDAKEKKTDDGVSVGVLAGIGFPRPLAVEGIVDIDRRFLVGAEYGFLPKTKLGTIETNLWSVAGDARFFPFRKGLFLGLRGGLQHLGAATNVSAGAAGTYHQSVAVDTWYVNPRVGFLWMWKPLAIGVEAGVQIPVSSTTTMSGNVPENVDTSEVRNTGDKIGKAILPTVDLLRVGLVF